MEDCMQINIILFLEIKKELNADPALSSFSFAAEA